MARTAGIVATALAAVWVVVAIGLLTVIGLEAVTLDDQSCAAPAADLVEGNASWQWWPPGEVCTVGRYEYSGPPASRGWLILGEVVLGTGLVVAWRRLRDEPEPDWTA